MTRTSFAWLVAALLMALVAGPAFAEEEEVPPPKLERSKEQAAKDALSLQELHDKYKGVLQAATGGVSVHETSYEGILKLCAEELPKLEDLERNVLPVVQPVLARVTELWVPPGAEEAARAQPNFDAAQFAYQQAGEVEWNIKMAASNNDVRAARDLPEEYDGLSTRYADLARWLGNVHKTRVANAAYLAESVKNQPEITFFVQDKRVDIMKQWKTILDWALKFDGANEYANARMANLDQEIADLEKSIEAEIDEKTWAGQMENFPGPGSVVELSRAAAEYLRKDRDWGNQGDSPAKNADGTPRAGVEIVAVAVRGPWRVAEKDIFGRVTSWRLPIQVAVTKPDLKAKNIARVYELSMVAATGVPGQAVKAPPFVGFWVGMGNWMMRLNKVPGAG